LLPVLARLGGKDIKVMARRPRGYFKASPWELDDAEEEGITSSSTTRPNVSWSRTACSRAWNSKRLEWDAEAKKSRVIEEYFFRPTM
jgi:hypothetical protein